MCVHIYVHVEKKMFSPTADTSVPPRENTRVTGREEPTWASLRPHTKQQLVEPRLGGGEAERPRRTAVFWELLTRPRGDAPLASRPPGSVWGFVALDEALISHVNQVVGTGAAETSVPPRPTE